MPDCLGPPSLPRMVRLTSTPWPRIHAGSAARLPADRIVVVLAWMDLEMTGLDPVRHVIVEIATLITDDDLAVVAEGPDLVVHADRDQLREMDHHVRTMHTTSGLLAEIKASPISVQEAGRQTLEFLREHIPEARTVPLLSLIHISPGCRRGHGAPRPWAEPRRGSPGTSAGRAP